MPREVTDDEQHVTWSCAQPFAGLGTNGARDDDAAQRAAERMAGEPGRVAVVCTPSGGAQSVRLALEPEWETALSDDALLAAIRDAG